MVSPENTNWLSDYSVNDCSAFSDQNLNFPWQIDQSTVSVEVDEFLCGDSDVIKEPDSKKRMMIKSEPCAGSSSKACKEKQRRDRLNDKFNELSSVLEPERVPKTDKVAILNDAIRIVNQVREETQRLKDLNSSLQDKIKELKDEKNELRDEKHKLKIEKEGIEKRLEAIKTQTQPCFLPNNQSLSQGQGSKVVPFTTYPGFAMWQFMAPAVVDTSQDHVLRPPVA